jgi:hypothetical protein
MSWLHASWSSSLPVGDMVLPAWCCRAGTVCCRVCGRTIWCVLTCRLLAWCCPALFAPAAGSHPGGCAGYRNWQDPAGPCVHACQAHGKPPAMTDSMFVDTSCSASTTRGSDRGTLLVSRLTAVVSQSWGPAHLLSTPVLWWLMLNTCVG